MTDQLDGYVRHRFRVFTPSGARVIEATYWELDGGVLVFRLVGPGLPAYDVTAFALGAWESVTREPDDEPG